MSGNTSGALTDVADFVDLNRYPIDRDCQGRKDLLTNAQAPVAFDGCVVSKSRVRPDLY